VDPLKVIQSHTSVRKQECKHAYHRKRSARLNLFKFKCGLPAVEPRFITSPYSGFTDCESASSDSDLIVNFLLTLSKEGGL